MIALGVIYVNLKYQFHLSFMVHVETFVNDVHSHTCRANDNEAFVIQYLPPMKCKIKTFNPHHACVNIYTQDY